jgi:hypothetical protein
MNMFKPDKSTISENKKERLTDCIEKYEEAYEKLMGTIENGDFDESHLEEIEELDKQCCIRLTDLKEEIKFS